jgi:hypothetical protein
MTGARETIEEEEEDLAVEEEEIEDAIIDEGTRTSVPSRKRLLLLMVGKTALFILIRSATVQIPPSLTMRAESSAGVSSAPVVTYPR